MFETIKNFFRKRRLEKVASKTPTGFLPLSKITSANFVIDVEEPGFDLLKEDILAWGRSCGMKVNIYFIDFRKLGKEELLLTSIQTTVIKRELNWFGMPPIEKVAPLIYENSDLFISLICNDKFPIEFVSSCSRARFKIGRYEYEGHPFNLIMSGSTGADLRSDARQIFASATELLKKIQ
jgi:hypothetical protein